MTAMDSMQRALAAVDDARDEIVGLLQDLVRLPTVNTGPRPDTGNETLACDLLAPKLEQVGIECDVLGSAPGRGNLLASVGQGTTRLLFMSHTDVVPVEDEGLWEHPPFSGAIDRGRIYGRGADDDKADVVAQCMSLVLLQRLGIRLDGQLVFLAAADEESGGRWGAGWLAEHHADRLRCDFAINEGGGAPIQTPSSGLLYPYCTGEKGRLEARVTRQGRSGHASRPWAADNPVPVLAEAVERIAAYDPEVDVSHPIFREVLAALGVKQAPTAENIDRILGGLSGHESLATTLKAASRMTITPTMLAAGVKSNSIPDRASLVCDVRALPGQDDRFVRQELEHVLRGLDVSVDVTYTAVANDSPAEGVFVDRMREALGASLAGNSAQPAPFRMLPALTVGFTDSRFVRPLGAQVYGFSPYDPDAEPTRAGVHGNNEFMEIESLLLRTRFFVALAIGTLGAA